MKEETVGRRAELKRQARDTTPEAAVYQIRNVSTGKVLVESTPNVKTLNRRRTEVASGVHMNARLREDLAARGGGDFVVEVLEVLQEPEEGLTYRRDALKRLEAAWIARLRPWGERGYHAPPPAGG
jgi:hypothetical protein